MREIWRHRDRWFDDLLAGRVESADGDQSFLAFVEAVKATPTPDPVKASIVTAAAEAARQAPDSAAAAGRPVVRPLTPRWRRRAISTTLLSSLLAKVLTAGVALATTTGGLAATGNLPDPAQTWLSERLGAIGIEIPRHAGPAQAPEDILELPSSETGEHCDEQHPVEATDCERLDEIFEDDPTGIRGPEGAELGDAVSGSDGEPEDVEGLGETGYAIAGS